MVGLDQFLQDVHEILECVAENPDAVRGGLLGLGEGGILFVVCSGLG